MDKFKDLNEVKKRVVFTTHTPELAGNEAHSIPLLNSMGFFNGLTVDQVNELVHPEHRYILHEHLQMFGMGEGRARNRAQSRGSDQLPLFG